MWCGELSSASSGEGVLAADLSNGVTTVWLFNRLLLCRFTNQKLYRWDQHPCRLRGSTCRPCLHNTPWPYLRGRRGSAAFMTWLRLPVGAQTAAASWCVSPHSCITVTVSCCCLHLASSARNRQPKVLLWLMSSEVDLIWGQIYVNVQVLKCDFKNSREYQQLYTVSTPHQFMNETRSQMEN